MGRYSETPLLIRLPPGFSIYRWLLEPIFTIMVKNSDAHPSSSELSVYFKQELSFFFFPPSLSHGFSFYSVDCNPLLSATYFSTQIVTDVASESPVKLACILSSCRFIFFSPFLAQDVSSSSCIFTASALESAISARTPGFGSFLAVGQILKRDYMVD